MSQLPYDVNGWVSTEALVAEMASSRPDFAPTQPEIVHVVDILGRLIPMELAQQIVQCRDHRLEVMVARMHIQRLLGEDDGGAASMRVQWACVLLMGAY